MANPTSRARARRDAILEAALAIIARKGFHRASVGEIAGTAHVSRATLYQYFAEKRDILRALADRVARGVIETADTWPPLPASPAEEVAAEASGGTAQLRAVISTRIAQILNAISADRDAARLIARLTRDHDEVADDALRRIDDHVVSILTTDIQQASGSGLLRSCQARTIARFLFGGIKRLVMDALDRDEPLELDAAAVAREVGAFVFFGLADRQLVARAPRSPSPATYRREVEAETRLPDT
jgi:TetR/AcrR family transcriptional repressor of mexJK operon